MMENIKILILLLIFSCNPQESNGHKKENPILKIEYNFYASSGGNLFIGFFIPMKKLLLKIWNISIHTKGKSPKIK